VPGGGRPVVVQASGVVENGRENRAFQATKALVDGVPSMKYMLLIYMDERAMNDAEREACYAESGQLAQDLHQKGQYVNASPLHPVATATSVRMREGKKLVTDGPFAETREQLVGFFLIDVKDLDEAIAVASRIPPARKGTVEIRPMLDVPGLPTG
jgi:hypothetical protein